MSTITQIKAVIHTGDRTDAGTDGSIYLGICGREFKLDRPGVNDFEQGTRNEFLLGAVSNVDHTTDNDPRSPRLDTIDTDRFPAYIRFEPDAATGNWDFDGAEVTITPGGIKFARMGEGGGSHLKLGQEMGKFCYLAKVQ